MQRRRDLVKTARSIAALLAKCAVTGRGSGFLRDVVLTLLTSVLVSGAAVIATPLLANGMGPSEFGAFSIARRLAFWATAISSLDMAVALSRYLGLSRGDPQRTRDYLISSCVIVAVCTALTLSGGLFFAEPLGRLLLGKSYSADLLLVSLLMMGSHGCYHLCYSYYRGVGEIWKGNLLQLAVLGVGGMVSAFFFANRGAIFVIGLTGVLYALPGVLLLKPLFGLGRVVTTQARLRQTTIELMRYGGPRVFAGFSYQGLLAIGPMVAATVSLNEVAYITLAQTSFMLMETVFGSFSLVALPRIAELSVTKDSAAYLQARVSDGIAFVAHVGIFATFQAIIWSDVVVHAWLGNGYQDVVLPLRILLLALTPYLAFTLLKSIIDGVDTRAINALNLVGSFGITAMVGYTLSMTGFGRTSAAIGVAVGFSSLGIMTTSYLVKKFYVPLNLRNYALSILVNSAIALGSAIVHTWTVGNVSGRVAPLAVGLATGIAAAGLYGLWLYKARVLWLHHLLSGLNSKYRLRNGGTESSM